MCVCALFLREFSTCGCILTDALPRVITRACSGLVVGFHEYSGIAAAASTRSEKLSV